MPIPSNPTSAPQPSMTSLTFNIPSSIVQALPPLTANQPLTGLAQTAQLMINVYALNRDPALALKSTPYINPYQNWTKTGSFKGRDLYEINATNLKNIAYSFKHDVQSKAYPLKQNQKSITVSLPAGYYTCYFQSATNGQTPLKIIPCDPPTPNAGYTILGYLYQSLLSAYYNCLLLQLS